MSNIVKDKKKEQGKMESKNNKPSEIFYPGDENMEVVKNV
jgi:hypothetical protein